MQENQDRPTNSVVSRRTADLVVALILIGVGALVMVDSLRRGAGWAEDGPQTGYFPFYIGLLIILSSLGTIGLSVIARRQRGVPFVERQQLKDVLRVLAPTAVFVALIGFTGIYVATAVFIAAFMRWLGRFRWRVIVPVAVLVPIALFLLFEVWFLVSLPKGPIEDYLGY
jgi:hypothetical protein